MFIFDKSVATLQRKSSEIIDVFTKTLEDLSKVNVQIQKARNKKLDKITKLDYEHKLLIDQEKYNNGIIEKINSFLQ